MRNSAVNKTRIDYDNVDLGINFDFDNIDKMGQKKTKNPHNIGNLDILRCIPKSPRVPRSPQVVTNLI